MLERITVVLLLSVLSAVGAETSLEPQLIGKWKSYDYAGIELNYGKDHTYTVRNDGTVFRGNWRIEEGDLLVTTSRDGRHTETDSVRITISGDRLYFGYHVTTTQRGGVAVGKPRFWTTGVSFRRAR